MKKGFSLVELSVVIVIIGVIVAAISLGTSLREQAKLRAVITDMKKYKSSYDAFKSIYKMAPGDFDQAAGMWGTTCAVVESCNGNGDGEVNSYPINSLTNETHKAWKHLELAGLIDNDIAIVTELGRGHLTLADAPNGPEEGSGYFIGGLRISNDLTWGYAPFFKQFGTSSAPNDAVNALYYGRESSATAFTVGVMTGLQAYNFDSKFDDAKNLGGDPIGSYSGYIRAINGGPGSGICLAALNIYNLTETSPGCVIGYQLDEDQ